MMCSILFICIIFLTISRLDTACDTASIVWPTAAPWRRQKHDRATQEHRWLICSHHPFNSHSPRALMSCSACTLGEDRRALLKTGNGHSLVAQVVTRRRKWRLSSLRLPHHHRGKRSSWDTTLCIACWWLGKVWTYDKRKPVCETCFSV